MEKRGTLRTGQLCKEVDSLAAHKHPDTTAIRDRGREGQREASKAIQEQLPSQKEGGARATPEALFHFLS